MAASQPGYFNVQMFTNLGDLGDGLRLYTYAPSTTTQKVAYTDVAGSVPHTYTSDGSGGLYIALDARGELPAPLFLSTGGYDLALKTAAGASIWTRRAYGQDDGAITLDTALRADLVDKTTVTKGPALVGFNPTLNYAAGTIGATFVEWNPKDYPWLAKFDGVTDDTAAILACWTAIRAAGGGTMVLPRGTTGITSLALDYATSVTVNIRGAGQHATYFKKIGATTTPVLDIKSNVSTLDIYSKFSGFQVLGANSCTGIRITNIAACIFEHVEVRVCDVALDIVGSLVNVFQNVSLLSSNTGVRTRKSGGVYCNTLAFRDCSVRSNATLGFDIGDASDFLVNGGHIESNGTAANLSTGAVNILATVDDEVGLSNIVFENTHFEGNNGTNFVVGNAAGLLLSLNSVSILSSEGGRALNVGVITNVALRNVIAASVGDVVTLAAATSSIEDCDIATITDTSTHQFRKNNTTSAGVAPFSVKTATIGSGGLKIDPAANVTDNGTSFTQGNPIVTFRDGAAAGNTVVIAMTNGVGGNAAGCQIRTGTHGVTGRSINSGGTINASGADYAEYEVKRDGCGDFAKGDIVGFTEDGSLTDRFADAISFGVKSTDPSYVGGDSWGRDLDGDALEAARQKVDRIAYAGKVPVNVTCAKLGDYIVPVAGQDGRIGGIAVSLPTLAQYMNAIGRVRSILPDGRAQIVVKVV